MKTKCLTKKRQLVTDGIDTSSNYQQKGKHPMPWTDVSQNMVKKNYSENKWKPPASNAI